MDFKRAVDKIVSVEKNVDWKDFEIDGVNYWPVARLGMWQELTEPVDKYKIPLNPSKTKHDVQNYFLTNLIKLTTSIYGLVILGTSNIDVLVVSRYANLKDTLDGRTYDKILDPIIENLPKDVSWKKIIIGSIPKKQRWVHKTISFPLPFLGGFIRTNLSINRKKFLSKVSKYSNLVDWNEIADICYNIIYSKKYYEILLKIARPKVVFLVCYYETKHFGLISACKKLDIPTVEVQHGKQGKYQAMYNHWRVVPKRGHDILPDYFMQWGKQSVSHSVKTSSKTYLKHHKHIAIGNFWISKWIHENDNIFTSKTQKRFLDMLDKKYTTKILITLQTITDPLPQFVIKFIKKLPKGTIVLVRLHPQMLHQLNSIKKMIPKNTRCEVNINMATQIPLYPLLKKSDVHITAYSSVVYEALIFGVPTIVFDKRSKILYKKDISNKNFAYAGTANSMFKQYSKLISADYSPTNSYIQIDKTSLKKDLARFLNNVTN